MAHESPKRTVEDLLEDWLDSTSIWTDGRVYKTKAFVASVRDLRIDVWPGDHNPPHFHVKSTQRDIDATFFLETIELRTDKTNKITIRDIKKIQEFFKMPAMRERLNEKFAAMQLK